jgi:hypothetical protein
MAKRYQRDNEKAQIEEGQTIQWPQNTYYVLLQLMPSDYPLVICWPLYRLSFFDLCLLITTLVSFAANRYQRGNQKAQIEVGQTISWPKDTKWVIRRHTLK